MKKRVLLTATAGVVALSLAPAARADTQSCGNEPPATHVTASGTTCKAAKKVVRAYRGNRQTRGYTCRGHTRKDGTIKVTCRRPGKVVTWIIFPRG